MTTENCETPPPFAITRRIWSDPTCMLLIFIGASAEFPVNPAVDWLFYTGRLPDDPIGRFLSTLTYVRRIVRADEEERRREAHQLRDLHLELERKREARIPAASYRDVLCMDTTYSIRSVPLVTGKELEPAEKDAVVADFGSVGQRMGLTDLPMTYAELCELRRTRLPELVHSEYTVKLLASYRRALGPLVYRLLLTAYPLLVEPELLELLKVRRRPLSSAMRYALAPACRTGLIRPLYRLLLPPRIKSTVLSWSV